MNTPNGCSREQLEMQAKVAQRRIEEIKKVLESGVQAARSVETDEDEKWFIDRLFVSEISEADLCGSIDTLTMLLSVDALLPLVKIMKDLSRPDFIRKQAARAICKIGSDFVREELIELNASDSQELRDLAKIAFGHQ